MRFLPHAVVLGCGLIRFLSGRYYLNPDGVSYLDMSLGVIQAEPLRLINAYWSPLFPFILGVGRFLLGGLIPDLFELAQLVNLVLFVLAWMATVALAQSVYPSSSASPSSGPSPGPLPLLSLVVTATVFASYVMTHMIISLVSADILLLGLITMGYVESVRIVRGNDARFKWLAGWLGLACLTKAIAMPFALLLTLTVLFLRRSDLPLRAVLTAGLVFGGLLALWVVPMSLQAGQPTLGDAAKLNRAWVGGAIPRWRYWTGEEAGTGHPTHGPTKLFDAPPVYYFGGVFDVTYPLWYDPAYWHAGLDVSPDADPTFLLERARQAKLDAKLKTSSGEPYAPLGKSRTERRARSVARTLFGGGLAILPFGVVIFLLLGRRKGSSPAAHPPASANGVASKSDYLILLAPGVACIALYAVIGVLLARHVTAFWLPVMVLAAAIAVLRSDERMRWPRLILAASAAAALLVCVAPTLNAGIRYLPDTNPSLREARQLQAIGLAPRSQLAILGDSFKAYWAVAGEYLIVADVTATLKQFCALPPELRGRLKDELAARGVAALVGRRKPKQQACDDPVSIANDTLLVWRLAPPSAEP